VIDLKALRETQGTIQKSRAQTGNDYCLQGYHLLAQALNTDFKDKAQLLSAQQKFIQAVRFQRSSAEPLVGLAYILLLLNQIPLAEKYLYEAIRLNPDHEDAQTLLASLPQFRKSQPIPETPEMLSEPTTLIIPNNDPGHEDAQVALAQEIQSAVIAAQNWVWPAPGLDPVIVESLVAKLEQIAQQYHDLKQAVLELEAEWDTTPLEIALYPLERVLRQGQKLKRVSDTFLELQAQIEKIAKQIASALQALQKADAKQLPIFESRLDRIMDSCDHLADEIDALQEQGYIIQALERLYEILLFRVEAFRDALDDSLIQ
jgi:tetratricopeptide (TPR) repeat protein